MAASQIGSRDKRVERMLALYVPSLLPPGAADLQTQASVQAASLVGLGLVHLASANRQLCEVMVREIGRTNLRGVDMSTPSTTSAGPATAAVGAVPLGLEAYALSAGMSLGLLLLGRGARVDAVADLDLDHILRQYLHGTAPAIHRWSGVGNALSSTAGPNGHNSNAPAAVGGLATAAAPTNVRGLVYSGYVRLL